MLIVQCLSSVGIICIFVHYCRMGSEFEQLRVSSVLNRNVKLYGKKHLIDSNPETCWNSDSGSPQWIEFSFAVPLRLSAVQLQFQGGFAGLETVVEAWNGACLTDSERHIASLHPRDDNSMQTFPLDFPACFTHYRITFSSSTDFFGRVTVYHLGIKTAAWLCYEVSFDSIVSFCLSLFVRFHIIFCLYKWN